MVKLTGMGKIPNMHKFMGDNTLSFDDWIVLFEAQATVNNIIEDNIVQVLLCCTRATAFSYVAAFLVQDPCITYPANVHSMRETFSGSEYTRTWKRSCAP